MKRILVLLTALLITASSFGQAPIRQSMHFTKGVKFDSTVTINDSINITAPIGISNLGAGSLWVDANGQVYIDSLCACVDTLTYAQAVTKRSNSTLNRGKWYYISDHDIYLTALNDTSFYKQGLHTRGFASEGYVDLLTGSSGSVDTIKVNGVPITSGPVAFATSLSNTATNVAANINAYTSTPNYTAIAAGNRVIILSATLGAGTNSFVVSTVLTTITASASNMANGVNAGDKWFDVSFDFENNIIVRMADKKGNDVFCSQLYQTTFGENTIDVFPWNLALAVDNKVFNVC